MDLSIIKTLRKEQGLSQKDLASLLDVSPSYIQKIECNKKNPSIPTLKKISSALNVELSSLLNNVEDDKSSYNDSNINLPSHIPLDLLIQFNDYINNDISIADKLNDIYLLENLYKYELKHLKDTYESRLNKLDNENHKLRLALAYLEAENKKLNNKIELYSSEKEDVTDCMSSNLLDFINSINENIYEDNAEEDTEDDDYDFYKEVESECHNGSW